MKYVSTSLVAVALTVAGCSSGSSGTFSTGVDQSKTLGTLSPSEVQQICASAKTFSDSLKTKEEKESCELTAVAFSRLGATSDADAKMKCKQQRDACLAQQSSPDAGSSGGKPFDCKPVPATCTATVGEYEACVNEISAAFDKARASVSCDTVTLMSGTTTPPLSNATPASCVTLMTKCPGAMTMTTSP